MQSNIRQEPSEIRWRRRNWAFIVRVLLRLLTQIHHFFLFLGISFD
jgi:hypothetical protein